MSDVKDHTVAHHVERRAALIRAAEARGLLGSKHRQLEGRFSHALIDEAKCVSGINEDSELLNYALITVALENDFGERLIARSGTISKGTLFAW
jgi:hypothetical protein